MASRKEFSEKVVIPLVPFLLRAERARAARDFDEGLLKFAGSQLIKVAKQLSEHPPLFPHEPCLSHGLVWPTELRPKPAQSQRIDALSGNPLELFHVEPVQN